MKTPLYILSFLFIMPIVSCDYLTTKICGEPEGKEKVFIDSINVIYKNRLVIKPVPCYPGYIQANLKADVSNETLDSIQIACRPYQWIEFLVYDKKGNLIRGNVTSM